MTPAQEGICADLAACETIEHLPFTTDEGLGTRARIGLVILASDYTIEHEFRRLLALPGVELYGARIENEPTITPETLSAMGARIAPTVRLILPGTPLDVVAYGCTSASIVLGEERVFAEIASVQPQARPTTPVTRRLRGLRGPGGETYRRPDALSSGRERARLSLSR